MDKKSDTKELLLQCAKKEFLEKGYMKASLRSICKQAGVTTGALYFFFKDKEDLFAALVEESFQKLLRVVEQHYKEESDVIEEDFPVEDAYDMNVDAVKQVVDLLYQYHDVFYLLVVKSHGSKFETCLEQLVEISEQHYKKLASNMEKQNQGQVIQPYMLHWIAHMQTEFFVQILIHNIPKEEVMKNIDAMIRYSTYGWFGMLQKE